MKRRTILQAGLVLAASVLSVGGVRFFTASRDRALAKACRDAFAASFPPEVVDQSAAKAFLERYIVLASENAGTYPPENVYKHFLTSTNVIAHLEQGDALYFDDIFHPHQTPCANHLGALYAPVGEHDA
ncbi:MAG: hypothetical protein VX874_01100 [Pseudomonadota bacterium]|nr:hypothetical protein [Pseudomonadota bacterium]